MKHVLVQYCMLAEEHPKRCVHEVGATEINNAANVVRTEGTVGREVDVWKFAA